MSRQSNLGPTSVIACTLSLLLASTAWAAVVNIHITVPIVHPKVPVVIVKPNVPHIAITTGIGSASGNTISGQSSGAGAGKVKFNPFSITKTTDTASPSLHKNATGDGAAHPKVGQSVVVSFEEGNPDKPVIVGSVYNGTVSPGLIKGKHHGPIAIAVHVPQSVTLRSMEGVQSEIIDARTKLQRDHDRTFGAFQVDRTSGTVQFGNGTAGQSPPTGATDVTGTYRPGRGANHRR